MAGMELRKNGISHRGSLEGRKHILLPIHKRLSSQRPCGKLCPVLKVKKDFCYQYLQWETYIKYIVIDAQLHTNMISFLH